jgi:hypothetical protein
MLRPTCLFHIHGFCGRLRSTPFGRVACVVPSTLTLLHGLCGRLRPTPRRRVALPPAPPLGAIAFPPNPLAMIMIGVDNDPSVHALSHNKDRAAGARRA